MQFSGSCIVMAFKKDFMHYPDNFILVAKNLQLAERQKDILLSIF